MFLLIANLSNLVVYFTDLISFQPVCLHHLFLKGLESLPAADKLYLGTMSVKSDSTHCGTQVFDVAAPVSHTDAVGQPIPHRWAAQCSTGEAVFIDDIAPTIGCLSVLIDHKIL